MQHEPASRAAILAACPFVSALLAAVMIGVVALPYAKVTPIPTTTGSITQPVAAAPIDLELARAMFPSGPRKLPDNDTPPRTTKTITSRLGDVAPAGKRPAPEIGAAAPRMQPKAVKAKKKARKHHRKARRGARAADHGDAAVAAVRSADRDALLSYAKAAIGKRGPHLGLPSRLWCADFINHLMRRIGLAGSGSRLARSFLWSPHFEKVREPRVGDIVVITRGRNATFGHVAIFTGRCGKGGIRLLGGNQRGGRVTNDCVYGRHIVGYVRPRGFVASDNEETEAAS